MYVLLHAPPSLYRYIYIYIQKHTFTYFCYIYKLLGIHTYNISNVKSDNVAMGLHPTSVHRRGTCSTFIL